MGYKHDNHSSIIDYFIVIMLWTQNKIFIFGKLIVKLYKKSDTYFLDLLGSKLKWNPIYFWMQIPIIIVQDLSVNVIKIKINSYEM